jgi:hypothetical protein
MDLTPPPVDLNAPTRRRRGRPKQFDDRQYVNLTAEQSADLRLLAEVNGSDLADEIRAGVDQRLAAARAKIEAARLARVFEGVISA